MTRPVMEVGGKPLEGSIFDAKLILETTQHYAMIKSAKRSRQIEHGFVTVQCPQDVTLNT